MTTQKENIITKLEEHLGKQQMFTTEELHTFYKANFPKIEETTITWKIHSLKEEGILHHVGRGLYSLAKKVMYTPPTSAVHKKIYKAIQKDFPHLLLGIWDTSWFNHFMNHQTGRNYIVIETEKEGKEHVFYRLTEQYKNVFLNPDPKTLGLYASGEREYILIKSCISESPWLVINQINVSTLEKMLVDCISENTILSAQQTELGDIFRNAFERYYLNINKARRYARRRNCLEKFDDLVNKFAKLDLNRSSK